jgi:NADH-quinone oxidoreductase subunit C
LSVSLTFPKFASNDGVIDAATAALGDRLLHAHEHVGEIALHVRRDAIVEVLTILRDDLAYQQLMEIAGVDYPDRLERFEVVYCLLSLTKNHRIRVHVATDEVAPVPSVTGIWPVAGWLEREVFDMYGVLFAGNPDLRRILTDYGFKGHPQRKDFPLTGYVELRYSEREKRVVYEPVRSPRISAASISCRRGKVPIISCPATRRSRRPSPARRRLRLRRRRPSR